MYFFYYYNKTNIKRFRSIISKSVINTFILHIFAYFFKKRLFHAYRPLFFYFYHKYEIVFGFFIVYFSKTRKTYLNICIA